MGGRGRKGKREREREKREKRQDWRGQIPWGGITDDVSWLNCMHTENRSLILYKSRLYSWLLSLLCSPFFAPFWQFILSISSYCQYSIDFLSLPVLSCVSRLLCYWCFPSPGAGSTQNQATLLDLLWTTAVYNSLFDFDIKAGVSPFLSLVIGSPVYSLILHHLCVLLLFKPSLFFFN